MPIQRRFQTPIASSKVLPFVAPTLETYKHKLLGAKEAADFLDVSLRTVRKLIKLRQVPYFRVRGQIKFDPQHLNDYLKKRFIRAAA
jgi:excisionase family DNA binding protein